MRMLKGKHNEEMKVIKQDNLQVKKLVAEAILVDIKGRQRT